MKKNANLANKRNRRRRNAFTLPLVALLGAALFLLPTDAAKADDFGFSLNLGCFSLNIGNNDDCCDRCPPIVVAPPKPAPRPIVVAPAPTPRPVVVLPPKPAPRPIVVAPPKPAPRPVVVAPPKGKARDKGPQIAARPAPGRPAVVRGQAPNAARNARAPRR